MAIYVAEPTPADELIFTVLTYISGVTYYVSATINPILYSIMSLKFRQAFKDTLGTCCGHRADGSTRFGKWISGTNGDGKGGVVGRHRGADRGGSSRRPSHATVETEDGASTRMSSVKSYHNRDRNCGHRSAVRRTSSFDVTGTSFMSGMSDVTRVGDDQLALIDTNHYRMSDMTAALIHATGTGMPISGMAGQQCRPPPLAECSQRASFTTSNETDCGELSELSAIHVGGAITRSGGVGGGSGRKRGSDASTSGDSGLSRDNSLDDA